MTETEELRLFQEEEFRLFAAAAGPLPRQFVWTQRTGSHTTEEFLVTECEQPASGCYDLKYESGERVQCALCPNGSVRLQGHMYFVYLLLPFVH
jgi:hypothetical protein